MKTKILILTLVLVLTGVTLVLKFDALKGKGSIQKNTEDFQEIQQVTYYKNNQYGFRLIFPPTWKGVKTQFGYWETIKKGEIPAIYFGFDFKRGNKTIFESIFSISMINHKLWDQIKNDEGPATDLILGQGKKYVYMASQANGFWVDLKFIVKKISELPEIYKSFKVLKKY